MRSLRLSEVADTVRGRLVGRDRIVHSAVTDSREAIPGALFFALVGSKTDGHRYLSDAIARGAAGVIVRTSPDHREPAVVVRDPLRALWDLARAERTGFGGPVVGIAGSTGKTTTKDMTAAVLEGRLLVHASPASFNNQVGVPLTILGASRATDVLVCEIGAGVVGEIAELCTVARPSIGVVTSVGLAHLETFGSRAAIAQAKQELVEALPASGVAVLNADDPVVRNYARSTLARVLTFGRRRGAHVRALGVRVDAAGRARFRLVAGDAAPEPVRLPVPGEHMIACALAAAAVGLALGVDVSECASRLEHVRLSRWRMEVFNTDCGGRVINDAYNANPASMRAALRTARSMAAGCRLVTVLGPMAELGPESRAQHLAIGRLTARLGVDRLVTVGADEIAEGAVRGGLSPTTVTKCRSLGDAEPLVRSIVRPTDLVLVKASRAAGLETLAEALRGSA